VLDLHAIPGHHLSGVPDSELILCKPTPTVAPAGTALAVPGYDDRPTMLQPAPDPGSPLLVVFHGQHGCIQNVQSRSDLDVIGAVAGVSVLWLSGAPLPARSWNTNGRCCEPASTQHVDDLAYLDAAMVAAKATGLTPTVVLSVGVSNGAGMAITAGCRRPDLFTGVVSVAGWMPITCGQAPLSLLVFGGTLDQKLGARTAAGIAQTWQTQVTSCTGDPVVETFDRRTTTTWSNCANGTVVRLVQLEDVPHVWPKFTFYDMDDDMIRFAQGEFAAAT